MMTLAGIIVTILLALGIGSIFFWVFLFLLLGIAIWGFFFNPTIL